MKAFFFLLVLALVLAVPVSALNQTIEAKQVSSYTVVPPAGYVIYEIIVNDLPMGINQTHVLNYNGAVFLLDIKTASSYVIFREAWVNLTLPDGSVQSAYANSWDVAGNYKTSIQPVFTQIQSATVPFLTVNLMIGLTPAIVSFSSGPVGKGPMGWNVSSAIPFTAASGNLGAITDVYCEIMTLDEFNANVVNYNPIFGLKSLGDAIFQWTWDMALGFISMIPVLGPLFITMISISGVILTEAVFWLSWIVDRGPAIILVTESIIMAFAVINAGKKPKIERVVKNLVNYNIMAGSLFIGAVQGVFYWIGNFISWVAAIISALKKL